MSSTALARAYSPNCWRLVFFAFALGSRTALAVHLREWIDTKIPDWQSLLLTIQDFKVLAGVMK